MPDTISTARACAMVELSGVPLMRSEMDRRISSCDDDNPTFIVSSTSWPVSIVYGLRSKLKGSRRRSGIKGINELRRRRCCLRQDERRPRRLLYGILLAHSSYITPRSLCAHILATNQSPHQLIKQLPFPYACSTYRLPTHRSTIVVTSYLRVAFKLVPPVAPIQFFLPCLPPPFFFFLALTSFCRSVRGTSPSSTFT